MPVIKDLQETDKTLYAELEKLELGQDGINERLDKGASRMDGIEAEVKKLSETLRDGLKDVISEVRDQKLSELKNELKDRKESDNGLKNDVIKIGIVAVLGAIGYLFIKEKI